MDSTDRSILKCLSENSRQSATEISRKVHLSIAAVIERIRKMERSGVIRQYTIVMDQHKVGNEVTALMEVSLEHPRYYEEFTRAMKPGAAAPGHQKYSGCVRNQDLFCAEGDKKRTDRHGGSISIIRCEKAGLSSEWENSGKITEGNVE